MHGKNIIFCQNSPQFMNTSTLHCMHAAPFLLALKQEARLSLRWKSQETSAKHARKLKVKWTSRDCTLGRALLRATVHTVRCALWLCTLHLSTWSLCTLPQRWSWWCGGKNQRLAFSRLHLDGRRLLQRRRSSKKGKARFKHLQLLLIFFAHTWVH